MNRLLLALTTTALLTASTDADDLADDLAKVRSAAAAVGVSDDAQQAWRRLSSVDVDKLPELLAAMKGAEPIAQNWLRAAVDAIAERQLKSGGKLPTAELEAFVNDTDQAPRARRTAFEWLTQVDPQAEPRLLAAMVNDPSMSLRYDAVAQQLDAIEKVEDDATKQEQYAALLPSARDIKQAKTIADALKELGEEVDLPGTLGFLKNWRVIGPFDNTAAQHFDTAYPPESEQVLGKAYEGKQGEVAWQAATAAGAEGELDLITHYLKKANPDADDDAINKLVSGKPYKESVAYVFATFIADAGDAEIRYQSGNATKVWLNGQFVTSNAVYHTGGSFDQYQAPVTLKQGENTVLVKICQNEQEKFWEKEWGLRLRVVDKLGTPVATQPAAGVDVPTQTRR